MNINEVAKLLGMTREEVKIIVLDGIELPISKQRQTLKAKKLGNIFDKEYQVGYETVKLEI